MAIIPVHRPYAPEPELLWWTIIYHSQIPRNIFFSNENCIFAYRFFLIHNEIITGDALLFLFSHTRTNDVFFSLLLFFLLISFSRNTQTKTYTAHTQTKNKIRVTEWMNSYIHVWVCIYIYICVIWTRWNGRVNISIFPTATQHWFRWTECSLEVSFRMNIYIYVL